VSETAPAIANAVANAPANAPAVAAEVSDVKNKPTIDLQEYSALVKALEVFAETKDWAKVLPTISDSRLFTCISHAGDLTKCIDELNLFKPPDYGIDYYIELLQEEFSESNKLKMKIKIYNNVFPHGSHLTEEEFKARHRERVG
jgi:hypothetical protein